MLPGIRWGTRKAAATKQPGAFPGGCKFAGQVNISVDIFTKHDLLLYQVIPIGLVIQQGGEVGDFRSVIVARIVSFGRLLAQKLGKDAIIFVFVFCHSARVVTCGSP